MTREAAENGVVVVIDRPDRPENSALIRALDDYLRTLYPPEQNYLLDVAALLQPDITFLTARLDGRAVGCAALRQTAAYGEVKRMYVDPVVRGRGIGLLLLRALERLARDHGLTWLRLETGVHQQRALRLYERYGFISRGPFGEYPEAPLSLFYEMRLC